MMELAFIGTCAGIALLAAADMYLAVQLWRQRRKELKALWLDIESSMIVLLSRASNKDDCPAWADPERWSAK